MGSPSSARSRSPARGITSRYGHCDSFVTQPNYNSFFTATCVPYCQNGGTCEKPNECKCTPWYTGAMCERCKLSLLIELLNTDLRWFILKKKQNIFGREKRIFSINSFIDACFLKLPDKSVIIKKSALSFVCNFQPFAILTVEWVECAATIIH